MARTYKPIKQVIDEMSENVTPSRNIANAIDRSLGNIIQHNTIADAKADTPATPAFERTSKVIGEYTNPEEGSASRWTFNLEKKVESSTGIYTYTGEINSIVSIPISEKNTDGILMIATFSSGAILEGRVNDLEEIYAITDVKRIDKGVEEESGYLIDFTINRDNQTTTFELRPDNGTGEDSEYEIIFGDSVTVTFELRDYSGDDGGALAN